MKRIYWSILVAIVVVLAGLFLGVGGLLWAPILAIPVMIGVIIWFLERKAKHEPPAE